MLSLDLSAPHIHENEMAWRIQNHDWASTSLGAKGEWPTELKLLVKTMLRNGHPMLICWGPELLQLYNDAFIPVLGPEQHPASLGSSARKTYKESWHRIEPMFKRVLQGETVSYENLLVPLNKDGVLEDCYFNFSYSPITDDDDLIKGILVICIETTANIKALEDLTKANEQLALTQKTLQNANGALRESEDNLHGLILQSPVAMALLTGPDLLISVVNDTFIELWGKDTSVRGKPIMEALPEMEGQAYPDILRHVYKTGETYYGKEAEVYLFRNGKLDQGYYNFINHPFRNQKGEITGVIVVANEVTESKRYQERLKQMVNELQVSESRFKELVENAPVGIGICYGRELIVEVANADMLKIWGKDKSVIGKPLSVALPELVSEDQPFLAILANIFNTGEAYYGNEERALLFHEGVLREGFFNYIFHPLTDDSGKIYAIMQVAIDVTQQVNARMELQRAEEMLRFSVEAANAALWSLEPDTQLFTVSKQFSNIYGLPADAVPDTNTILSQIPEEYRKRVLAGIENAINEGDSYSMEHPVKMPDGRLRWVKALGRLHPGTAFRPANFSGLTIDITEQKQDELRKNDFIGMVSHELKTPLTSLSAIVQVMKAKLKGQDDSFLNNAAGNAEKQVKRMTAMINGFLNVSRLESGKIQLKKEPFDLEELLEEVAQESRLLNTHHHIHFDRHEEVPVVADRDKINSVVSNLLSNAAKYSAKDTYINLTCYTDGNMVKVSVSDRGMGIKAEDQQKLFDRYYRVDNQNTKHISGFGIGLYLSAEIIQMHGGEISVESQPGEGATFIFTLPAGQA